MGALFWIAIPVGIALNAISLLEIFTNRYEIQFTPELNYVVSNYRNFTGRAFYYIFEIWSGVSVPNIVQDLFILYAYFFAVAARYVSYYSSIAKSPFWQEKIPHQKPSGKSLKEILTFSFISPISLIFEMNNSFKSLFKSYSLMKRRKAINDLPEYELEERYISPFKFNRNRVLYLLGFILSGPATAAVALYWNYLVLQVSPV